ncbi:hypothetical protein C5167_011787 [Papaver somniferum]|uniref:uncharacterized protein LOC113342461 n=1 Tax=Papaver somniferum TaxID=3469 RepID=UPI000E6FEDA4|nr:uncharacterized protein LOC113342461 [Papaver somniferum]RZC92706.1 hypothetical protein C5167_011787 [Papaver somniferum]
MSGGGLTILDGTQLRSINPVLPNTTDAIISGAELVKIADDQISSSFYNFSLPEYIKSNAVKRINLDSVAQLDKQQAESKLCEYILAIADELKDDPVIVSVLDGKSLCIFLEDEDDFAMLAENLFTDLDVEDTGKITKSETRNALLHMGVEMGVPPFSEFTHINDILKKHGAEGDEELGQAQFAELLQLVLQDLADALAEKPIVIIQNVKIINGSKLRKFFVDEKQLNNLIEKISQDIDVGKDKKRCMEKTRKFLEENGSQIGLPSTEANESVVHLFDQVFSDVDKNGKSDNELGNDDFGALVIEILENFAQQLDTNPVFHGLDC